MDRQQDYNYNGTALIPTYPSRHRQLAASNYPQPKRQTTPRKQKQYSSGTSSNSIQLPSNRLDDISRLALQPRQKTTLSELRTLEESQGQRMRDLTFTPAIRREENSNKIHALTPRLKYSYDARGDGKVFTLGRGESYRPGGDPPRSPIGRVDTFRTSDRDRDRDRSPRRERARTPIRDRDRERARTPLRDRVRTPIRDRARTPIRERARTPPPTDRYLPPSRDRSPRRRSRSPGTFRRRERTPARDSREGSTWRARDRARTPPRRISPRRDSPRRGSSRRGSPRRPSSRRASPRRPSPRRDSPRRDDYRRERVATPPRRDLVRDIRGRSRSPLYDRDRPTPRARSPFPSRRSPPLGAARAGGWRRSRSPERRNIPTSLTWHRPRSPTPLLRDSLQTSGRDSGSTSRRSSPPIHPSRIALHPSRDPSPAIGKRSASPPVANYRDEDADMNTPQNRSSAGAPTRQESPARRSPPRGPSGYRAPPSGPSSGQRNFTAPVLSVSAHNRPENSGVLAVPAGPRGYQPPFRGRGGGRGSFSSVHRTENTWHNPATARPTTSVSPTIPATIPTAPSGIPTGPRAGNSHTIVSDRSKTWTAAPPRAPASTTSTFLRAAAQRFDAPPSKPHIRNHPSLSTLPTLIVGGRKDPNASGIPREIEARLKKYEEEEERLREDIRVKDEKTRAALRTWERLERECEVARLRSELSEQQVRILAGEGIGGAF